MPEIVLLDTSVFLNLLAMPGFSQAKEEILEVFQQRVEKGDSFLLPMATIWETGNHVARLPDGRIRRIHAENLVRMVEQAFDGKAPFRATYFPDRDVFRSWLKAFPDHAQRSKSAQKLREGVSLGDLSIIQECEQLRRLHPMSKVVIWSLDADMAAWAG